jgi:hypothetical protein
MALVTLPERIAEARRAIHDRAEDTNSVAHDDAACTAPVQLGTPTDDEIKWEPAKLPAVLARGAIQRPAMLGIRLEEPTRSGNRFPEVSAPNWR